MNANQIGIALKGRRNGRGWLVRCPCPNHGKGRGDLCPSLSVEDGDEGRLLLFCFAGCPFEDILDELDHRGLTDDEEREPRARPISATPHRPNADAVLIWRAAEPVHHTLADEYLSRRGITLRPPTLRFRPDRREIVAAIQAPDGNVIAIQRTRLTSRGEKIERLTSVGGLGAGCVRLGPASRVLGIAEGVETALSAMQMTGITTWASLGAARLDKIWLPPTVEEVHIFGDDDDAGRKASDRAALVHVNERRTVVPRFPPPGLKDYNDLLNFIADTDGRDLLTAKEVA
jgi:putative DNA primase/helicase